MNDGTFSVNDPRALHQILVRREVTAARERIERVLDVETTAEPWGEGFWAIRFLAPQDVDLDFLRPDVLPPKTS